jgi:hypothetical protein
MYFIILTILVILFIIYFKPKFKVGDEVELSERCLIPKRYKHRVFKIIEVRCIFLNYVYIIRCGNKTFYVPEHLLKLY